jgi:hypothetical protein
MPGRHGRQRSPDAKSIPARHPSAWNSGYRDLCWIASPREKDPARTRPLGPSTSPPHAALPTNCQRGVDRPISNQAAAYEVHNLQLIAFPQLDGIPGCAGGYLSIMFDGDAVALKTENCHQIGKPRIQRKLREVSTFAIDDDTHLSTDYHLRDFSAPGIGGAGARCPAGTVYTDVATPHGQQWFDLGKNKRPHA